MWDLGDCKENVSVGPKCWMGLCVEVILTRLQGDILWCKGLESRATWEVDPNFSFWFFGTLHSVVGLCCLEVILHELEDSTCDIGVCYEWWNKV
jgi:hypothetical protein